MPARFVPKNKIGTFVAYLYLLRVQIIIGLTIFVLPYLALGSRSMPRSLLENLFVIDPPGVFLTTLTALLLAWSLLLTSRLVLLNGLDRFGVEQWWTSNTLSPWALLAASIIAAPMVGAQFIAWQALHRVNETPPTAQLLAAIALGILAAYLLVYVALLLAVLVAPIGAFEAAETFPSPWFLRRLLVAANHMSPPRVLAWILGPLFRLGRWASRKLPLDICEGYFDEREMLNGRPNPGYQLPWSGHFLALTFFSATLIVYYSIGWYRSRHVGADSVIPALTFLLLLLLLIHWIAAFLTFLFDRFRVPVIATALLLALVSSCGGPDHLFETVANGATGEIRPHEVVMARVPATSPPPIVVVATAGGGIQAAVWTAKVLTELERESIAWPGGPFSSRIALVSAVSGGAVGSMFFLNEYTGGARPGFGGASYLDTIVQAAEAPGLDDVGWSLVYNDVPRVFSPRSPSDPLMDRGRMLELYWRRQADITAKLSDWRTGVREGWRPAVIFNATIAETGEPLLLATSDLKIEQGTSKLPVRKSFHQLYPGLDVPVVTAVRLASSFPYVSPAARANRGDRREHLIDGGYYDNYGVASAIDWISQAIDEYPKDREFPPVLFVLIKSFPDDAATEAKDRGWFFQSYAPLLGLFNVRTSTQLVRDRAELVQLRDRLGVDAEGRPRLRFATFQFPDNGAPLSWKINGLQIDAIENRWSDFVQREAGGDRKGDDLAQLKCMLLGSGASQRCAEEDVAKKAPW